MAWFDGFESGLHPVGEVELFARSGGDRSKPPLLLLHGFPQTHAMWHRVARALAADFRLVIPDLRGYGDSTKPTQAATPELDHAQHSKRAMAADLVALMRSLGHDRFAVVGHDRGGRVGHRMALDHPDKITKLAVLDIVPTYYLYTHVDIRFIQSYFHWFNNVRAAPAPENDLKAQYEAQKARTTNEVQLEYLRTSSDPANIHALCEDYRAGASIDLEHDAADVSKKIACPLLTLWGLKGPMGRIYDVLAIWKERAVNASGKGLGGGHNLQEDVPDEVLAEFRAFLSR